jgi:PAS domain S-box-containing protein
MIGVIIGASRKQVLSQNFREIESWKMSGLLDVAEEVLSKGIMRALDIHTVTTFGKNVWLECCLSRFKSAGEFHLLLTVNDITDRKKIEDTLRESEIRYRTVLEASPDPISAYDKKGEVIYVNPAFIEVFGWELEDLLDKKIAFVPKENLPDTERMINRAIAGESFIEVETQRYTKGGNIIDVSMSAAVYLDCNGIPQGCVVNMRDITEYKKLEAELRKTQKIQAVGRLAAGVAHEINNPLTAILTSIMLLQEDIDPKDSIYKELQMVIDEALRCRNIVNSLLDFAREPRPTKRNNNIVDIIEHIIILTNKQAVLKDISMESDYANDSIYLYVDKNLIEQALVNIILNAIEATDSGGKIAIKARLSQMGDMVEVLVSDSGIGILEDNIDKIFDPFFTTKEDGNGLGLSVTHGIIEQHSGSIVVESTSDLGTTFMIRLPTSERNYMPGNHP